MRSPCLCARHSPVQRGMRLRRHSCGWGSAALYFAELFPRAKVVAFSNSKTQKEYIDGEAQNRGLKNLEVITGNVVDYEFEHESFDRVVSIEASCPEYKLQSGRGLTQGKPDV